MLYAIIWVCLLLILAWWSLRRHFTYWQRRCIPHNKPKIPQGNMYGWLRHKHLAQIFGEAYSEFKGSGPYAGFYFNTQKAVIVLDVDLAKRILNQDFEHFEDRGFFHNEKDDPLTGSLYLLDGEKWRSLKLKMDPLFQTQTLKEIYPSVLEVGEELQRVFDEKVTESSDGFIDIAYLAARYTTDVIANCAFGLKCNSLKAPRETFCLMARHFFSKRRHNATIDSLINCFPSWAKTFRMKIIPQIVTDYYMKTLKHNVRIRESKNDRTSDFLNLLIELKNRAGSNNTENLTLNELVAQSFSFFITAFDTCSTTMSYALFELARNQNIQSILRNEIVRTLRSNGRKLSFECLTQMKYLDKVIMETLRKHPAIPVVFRKCTKHFVPSDPKYYIEKGCTIIIPTLSYHHDPKYFPDPKKFDPQRFSSANKRRITPRSYLPFGDGQRSCMGKEFGLMLIKIGLVKFIQNYKFEMCDITKLPIEIAMRSFNLNPLDITLKVTRV